MRFAHSYYFVCTGAPIPGGNGAGSLHDVEIYDIDISYPSSVVADLQSKGKKVMCYVSGGTAEEFRDDINLFPEEVKGGIVSFGEGDTVRAAMQRWKPVLMPPHQEILFLRTSLLEGGAVEPRKCFRWRRGAGALPRSVPDQVFFAPPRAATFAPFVSDKKQMHFVYRAVPGREMAGPSPPGSDSSDHAGEA